MPKGIKQQRRSILTSGQVALHCEVSYETVTNWIRRGQLKAHQTPGGHNRIRLEDFTEFLSIHGMPDYDGAASERPVASKILVVDDNPSMIKMYKRIFSSTPYEVLTAVDGFEAGFEVANFAPTLVILDLVMPGIDGFSVCRSIKSNPRTSHIQILIVTGFGTEENIAKAKECGADNWMDKPVHMRGLLNKVEEMLTGRRRKTSRGSGENLSEKESVG